MTRRAVKGKLIIIIMMMLVVKRVCMVIRYGIYTNLANVYGANDERIFQNEYVALSMA